MTGSRVPAGNKGAVDASALQADLLSQRLSAVGEASALNARSLQLTQQLHGIEMDVLRIELELRRRPDDAGLAKAHEEATGRLETTKGHWNACRELLDAHENEIAEIDRQLAMVTARGKSE